MKPHFIELPKGLLNKGTIIFPVSLGMLLIFASIAFAQSIVSTRAGLIHHMEGRVFLDGKRLEIKLHEFCQLENGQNLRTAWGRVELLLNPGVFLWLGGRSSLRMEDTWLKDTQVALDAGTALIEVVDRIKDNRICVRLSDSLTELKREGLYRFEARSGKILVYNGEAIVDHGSKKTKLKRGKMVIPGDGLEPIKFDNKIADSLHEWAAQRSFELFNATRYSRSQKHWIPSIMGWVWSNNFQMRFYSEIHNIEFINEIRTEERIRAAQEQARIKAAQEAQQRQLEIAK